MILVHILVLCVFCMFTFMSDCDDVGIGTTAVNFLAIVFQIFYGPGTLIGIMSMKRRGLRGTLVLGGLRYTLYEVCILIIIKMTGGWLTFAGATLRVIAAYWKDEIG